MIRPLRGKPRGPSDMKPLLDLVRKSERTVVGLNSGTSMDGTDVVVARFKGAGESAAFEILAEGDVPHPPDLRARLLRAPDLSCAEVCRLHRDVAEAFAAAARAVLDGARLDLAAVDAIGSHGQTICHLPAPEGTTTPSSAISTCSPRGSASSWSATFAPPTRPRAARALR
jgi:1,6-anhydro-N-acetylmuramate kinase